MNNLRLGDQDDICIRTCTTFQPNGRVIGETLVLAEDDGGWDMRELLVLEYTKKTHGDYIPTY